jgi:hypothetical protein
MKTNYFQKGILLFSVWLFMSLFQPSCTKEKSGGDTYSVSGNGSASQVVPPNSSTATATLTGTYYSSNRKLEYDIKWTGLTNMPSVVHFHGPASVGANANIMFTLTITNGDLNGSSTGHVFLNASQEAALLAGEMYYDIHNMALPDGEIRGQVSASKN